MLRPVVNFWMQPMDAASPKPAYDYWKQQIENALLAPVRAMRLAYLPLLMVYFAYGATGLTAVAQAFWVKEALVWTPAELASLAVWFSLPWTVKMVFGELVDTVPLLGSQRRTYVFLGAALVAISFVLLAGAAGGWITVLSADKLYVVAMLLATLGVVIQDVVADAMSTEVVPRTNPDGSPRAKAADWRCASSPRTSARISSSVGTSNMPSKRVLALRSAGSRSRARSVFSSASVKSSVNQPVTVTPSIVLVVLRAANSG